MFFGLQLGSFLGVWLGGIVYDATHAYDLLWYGASVLMNTAKPLRKALIASVAALLGLAIVAVCFAGVLYARCALISSVGKRVLRMRRWKQSIRTTRGTHGPALPRQGRVYLVRAAASRAGGGTMSSGIGQT